MKFTLPFFVIFLLISCINSSSIKSIYKPAKADSLKKYSYPLMGFSTHFKNGEVIVSTVGGTCFFVRKNNKIFLVTAKHVLTGCMGIEGRSSDYPRSMSIFIRDSINNIDTALILNTSNFRNNYNCIDSLNNPDIVSFEVKNSGSKYLNSVEKFIMPRFDDNGDMNMYGFNTEAYPNIPNRLLINTASHIHINSKDINGYSAVPTNDSAIIDTTYYMIVGRKLRVDSAMHGFSGSPIFYQSIKSKKIRIMGVFSIFGYDKKNKDFKYWQIPKIEHALNRMKL